MAKNNPTSEPGAEQTHLLVVDDDWDNLEMLTQMMECEGYLIQTANSGEEGLDCVMEHPPDLILLDINMPDINGYEVCQILKSEAVSEKIPVIFLTALDTMDDKIEGFKAGGCDFITKPFQLEEVLARVSVHTDLHRLQRKLAREIDERTKAEKELQLMTRNLALRVQSLACLHGISRIMEQTDLPLEELFQESVELIVQSMPYPEKTAARITYGNESFKTHNFQPADLMQTSRITLNDKPAGMVEVAYLGSQPHGNAELFFEEGRELIYTISKHLGRVLERKEMELEMVDAKEIAESANRFKSEFMANMSHELRNSMHHILSYARLGIEKIPDVNIEKVLHYFEQIKQSGDNAQFLLNDLLDLSNLDSGKICFNFAEASIFEIVSNVVVELEPIASENNQKIELERPDIELDAICDKIKIGQVVRNLLINAIKVTPHHKNIAFTFSDTETTRDDRIQPALRVSIADQGKGLDGISPDDIFHSRIRNNDKSKSGGLGLAICKKIIQEHQGKIWAENHPDGGAVVSFVLPYNQG